MTKKERAHYLDQILRIVRPGTAYTDKMKPLVPIDYAFLCYLCEVLQERGLVTLSKTSSRDGDGIQEYLVKITNKGIAFIDIDGGFSEEFEVQNRSDRYQMVKTVLIVVQSIAILILTFAPLGYQVYRDIHEKKKVVKLQLSREDISKLKELFMNEDRDDAWKRTRAATQIPATPSVPQTPK